MLPLTMASQGEPMAIKKIGGKQETKKILETLEIGRASCRERV